MPVGLLTLEICVPDARSLKDKRQVLRSLKDRLRQRFNVAIAELDGQNSWQRAVIGVVTVSNTEAHLNQSLREVQGAAERFLERDLVGSEIVIL